jgi:signal transduction histidine kinase
MAPLNTITLLLNGLTLALALSFLIIVLWNDLKKELNQFFAIFLALVALWNAGAFMAQAVALIVQDSPLVNLMLGVMELGFTGSSIAVYALTTVLVKLQSRQFRYMAFVSLLLVAGYRVFLLASGAPIPFQTSEGFFTLQAQPVLVIFYLIFDMATLYLVLRYHGKARSRQLTVGIVLFVIGQSVGFLNPELQTFSLSLIISSLAALIISFAILRREIITPLAERISQVEAMHKVSLAITSALDIDTVLREIATQAAHWLDADAAGIFLSDGAELKLESVYELPEDYIGLRLPVGEGMVGQVAETNQSAYFDNYARDWKGTPDLPYARDTFGAVICTPLTYAQNTIGVLIVIAGRHGRLFEPEDVRLLDFLGAQAAVVIRQGRIFSERSELAVQLETLLNSTKNPVVAFDRQFKLIFSNPAADEWLHTAEVARRQPITDVVPAAALPDDYRTVLRELRRQRAHVYEVTLDDRVFLCQIAQLGRERTTGWVAILNDVTELKELDRLKSEMVRMTSHDLKNPLQAAMAHLELLTEDLEDVIDRGDIRESITTIETQLVRMHRIISGILDLERVRSGMSTTEVCSPQRVIDHVAEGMRVYARQEAVNLEVEVAADTPNFIGDYDQFQSALINLVENAIKFTPGGGKVNVRAYRQNDQVVFCVRDTGIGIPGTMQARIFDRFYRGKQKGVEHISGSGLGLSLVKAVAENHHGDVRVESQVGVGTSFFLSVPAVARAETVDLP